MLPFQPKQSLLFLILRRHVVLLLYMNMYLAFIIHDISGIRSKETQKAASKQAACSSSNVHRCTDEAGSLAPPPPLAAAKRSDVDIQSPS